MLSLLRWFAIIATRPRSFTRKGFNHANAYPTSHSVVLDVPGKFARCSGQGSDHQRGAGCCAGFSHALHGCAGAERRRSDQRRVATGSRTVVKGKTLSVDLSRAYELLGVKPGVSPKDLKAAHRDLAKVWHPDRFLHDPRLQEKAQEKLKEINEAYELLSSGKTPRSAPPPPPPRVYTVDYEEVRVAQPRGRSHGAVAVLLFLAVFAVTITVLLQRSRLRVAAPEVAVEEPVQVEEQAAGAARAEVNHVPRKANKEELPAEVAQTETVKLPAPEVATVTVTIDPETGLLAKPECRLRSRMSYPSGSEPKGYCNLSHAPPPKDGKIKSAVKWLESK